MDSSSQDRNLPATERKIQKAREEGQIARSRDLTHLAILGAGFGLLAMLAPEMTNRLKTLMAQQMRFDAAAVMQTNVMAQQAAKATEFGLGTYLPLAAGVIVAAILATLASGGWILTFKPVMPDPSRLSPMQGIGKLFSMQQLAETAKLLVLMLIMSVLGWVFLSHHLGSLATMLLQSLNLAVSQLASTLLSGAMLLTTVVLVVAAIDVPLQAYLHGSRLKMSHQEVKQEHKEAEGNPMVKGRQRQKQREMAQRSSVNAVPKADLVVMNPTHYAVALRYDEATMRAPKVIAKGADLIAMRIRDMAKSHAVPVLQAPMLARALYANAEIDQEVPSALYTAVAQVLAYVYQLKASLRGEAPAPQNFQAPEVPPELDPHTRLNQARTES